MFTRQFYIFNSRIATHVFFWVTYYVVFSLIWAANQGITASFFLEFILLPIRIMAVYVTIYYLLPNYLLKKKYLKFIAGYGALIFIAAILQRIFIHFFYENLLLNNTSQGLFSFKMLLRATVLINTTVFLVLSFKIFQLFLIEREKNEKQISDYLEIKADRRMHHVHVNDILFIEGQGNYTTYNLSDKSKITAYGSIKKVLETLPDNFIRVHKSYIVNRNEIKSYDANTVAVKDQLIPRGKSVTDDVLLIKTLS